MAYDGNDEDGYQSSLQQAEEGLRDFEKNGADISKINIGIAIYGRPISGTPYLGIVAHARKRELLGQQILQCPRRRSDI